VEDAAGEESARGEAARSPRTDDTVMTEEQQGARQAPLWRSASTITPEEAREQQERADAAAAAGMAEAAARLAQGPISLQQRWGSFDDGAGWLASVLRDEETGGGAHTAGGQSAQGAGAGTPEPVVGMLSQSDDEEGDGAAAGARPEPRTWAQVAAGARGVWSQFRDDEDDGQQRGAQVDPDPGAVYMTGPQWEEAKQQEWQRAQQLEDRRNAPMRLQRQAAYIAAARQARPGLNWEGMDGPPGSDAAEVAREARMEAWLQARILTPEERARRMVPRGRLVGPVETTWARGWRANQADLLVKDDCRGIASVLRPQQVRWRVWRVPSLRDGYCCRNTCECCAPEEEGGNWCGCRAVQDNLCRKCWIDWHSGTSYHGNMDYYGPGMG